MKKYKPSNGTEGLMFQDAYCDRCIFDAHYQDTQESGTGCYLLRNSFVYEIDDSRYPTEWIEEDEVNS